MTAAFTMGHFVVMQEVAINPDRSIILSWSDDAGANWSNPVSQSIGRTGAYETSISFWRMGYSRNRVWRFNWSGPDPTAFLGAFVKADIART